MKTKARVIAMYLPQYIQFRKTTSIGEKVLPSGEM